MIEHVDRRVLGAIRWVDAVTQTLVAQPLAVDAPTATLTRNHRGLFVITAVAGLEPSSRTFDLGTLAEADVEPDETVTVRGQVADPTGTYLPRSFTVRLPRPAAPGRPLPGNSLFKPMDLELLPAPQAKVMAGWAQVRLRVTRPTGEPFPQVLVRVVLASDHGRVLGRGMSDARGEALVVVPGLPLFQPGATPDRVVTSETAAHVEFIPPPAGDGPVDWTELDAAGATAGNLRLTPLALQAGGTSSLQFIVTPGPPN